MPTPRPRPRKGGTVSWQVPFHYYDIDGQRQQSSETFDNYSDAQWWADLADKIGIDQALEVLGTKRDTGSEVVSLVDWLSARTRAADGSGPFRRRTRSRTRHFRVGHSDSGLATTPPCGPLQPNGSARP
ncbi:hypothetical protein [Nocardia lijiangensis]|uniref:hypothetical protein n=1 Tax=Nocardia lijiangensis TaxID=299618 RepID=UPI000831609C|nr:hypothetical protein [Nocardia lijiangensis]